MRTPDVPRPIARRALVAMAILCGGAPRALAAGAGLAAEQLARELEPTLPAGFTVAVEPPFVVVGDGPAPKVRRHATRTVAWAVRLLRQDFFDQDPARPMVIWLFKDAKSYRRHTRALFGEEPDTPFGYYDEARAALVMNIATGGGTLVHEIVHPFVEADFPRAPAWLNEGLGSLFEQCRERDGHIVGLTNWRLAELQAAIRARALPSFEALTRTTSQQFYGADPGSNYAQARYLLLYLQERGLLRGFYQRFRAAQAEDPTGYRTLAQTLGEADMPAFQERWEAWVLQLSFP